MCVLVISTGKWKRWIMLLGGGGPSLTKPEPLPIPMLYNCVYLVKGLAIETITAASHRLM